MSEHIFTMLQNENYIDLVLFQCGWEQCAPAHSCGPIAKSHYLFHYVISGTGTLEAEDSKGVTRHYSIRSGQGFMLFPGQVCSYTADREIPWEYTWLEFDGVRVKEALQVVGLTPGNPIYHSHSKDLRQLMMEEMLYIVHHGKEAPYHLLGHGFLFLDYLTRSMAPFQGASSGKIQDFYIKEAVTFIEQNFQNDISVEDIARHCGLNRSYFGTLFRQSLGQTPQEFLIQYRMVKATELLKLTRLSVQDIASAVGYSNPLHFSRAFKKVYGKSPRVWRSEHQTGT